MLIIRCDTWQLLGLKALCKLDGFENIQQRNLLVIFSKTKLFMLVLCYSKLKKKGGGCAEDCFPPLFPLPAPSVLLGRGRIPLEWLLFPMSSLQEE